MKILIITTVEIGYDGLTNHILSYVEGMDKNDIIIDLVSARGINKNIKSKIEAVGFNDIIRLEYRDNNQLKYLYRLAKLIRKNKYDIVHVHGNSATLAIDILAALLGGCRVRIAHSHNTMCEHGRINQILKPVFLKLYTHGFACGQQAGEWMFGSRPFTIIPNGKEINKFLFDEDKRIEYRKKLNLQDNDVAIGNVAAFVKKKNHLFLLDVFSKLVYSEKNYELYLFGIDGDALTDVLQTIETLGLKDKVHYMGTKDNIQDYLNAMDMMVLPSLFEGFPISVIEWQINGLPCVISNTITEDCNITGNVQFVPIDKGVNPWVDELKIEKKRNNKDIRDTFVKAGFDINTNAQKLKENYAYYKEKYK